MRKADKKARKLKANQRFETRFWNAEKRKQKRKCIEAKKKLLEVE